MNARRRQGGTRKAQGATLALAVASGLAAAFLGIAIIGSAVPASAAPRSTPEIAEDLPVSVPDGWTCSANGFPLADGGWFAQVTCTGVPAGLQFRAKAIIDDWPDAEGPWQEKAGTSTIQHFDGGDSKDDFSLTIEIAPTSVGSDCRTWIESEEVAGRNKFRVGIVCDKLAENVKVRGVADFFAQPDELTPWVTAAGVTEFSEWKRATDLVNDPGHRAEWEIR